MDKVELRKLDLGDNGLEILPEWFAALGNLEELHLYHNKRVSA
jgi:Leucine-rich repeat (LRR) protein